MSASSHRSSGVVDVAIGIEIGGTKLQAAAVTAAGRLLARRVDRVDAAAGAGGIREALAGQLTALAVEPLPAGHLLRAVGIGFGGPVDRGRGVVGTSFHVGGWRGFPLVGWVREHLTGEAAGLPIVLENDANAAALGEAVAGAGAGSRVVFYSNAGSGIGAGLVVDGRLYHGRPGGELELGHLRLAPQGDILETLASGWALDRRVREAAETDPAGPLARAAATTQPSARQLPAALAASDPTAIAMVETAAGHYAHALSHVVHLLNPDVIVLGGGVAAIGLPWRDAVARRLEPLLMETMRPAPPVRLAALGENVVPVGAALVALQAAVGDDGSVSTRVPEP